jgi:hypothetical protein
MHASGSVSRRCVRGALVGVLVVCVTMCEGGQAPTPAAAPWVAAPSFQQASVVPALLGEYDVPTSVSVGTRIKGKTDAFISLIKARSYLILGVVTRVLGRVWLSLFLSHSLFSQQLSQWACGSLSSPLSLPPSPPPSPPLSLLLLPPPLLAAPSAVARSGREENVREDANPRAAPQIPTGIKGLITASGKVPNRDLTITSTVDDKGKLEAVVVDKGCVECVL